MNEDVEASFPENTVRLEQHKTGIGYSSPGALPPLSKLYHFITQAKVGALAVWAESFCHDSSHAIVNGFLNNQRGSSPFLCVSEF